MAADPVAPTTATAAVASGGDAKVMEDGTKITLYWLDRSRSHRLLWLLEELSLPYMIKTYQRGKNMLAPESLKKIHPLGKAPILTISNPATTTTTTTASATGEQEEKKEDKPLVLAESGAVMEYLIEHFGPQLAPKKWKEGCEGKVGGEEEGWVRWRYYMHYAEGTLMPYLVMGLVLNAVTKATPLPLRPLPALLSWLIHSQYLIPNLTNNFSFLESQLASSPNNGKYICGEALSGADILLSFPLSAARGGGEWGKGVGGLTRERFPLLWEYVGRLEGEGGFRKAVERGGEAEKEGGVVE